MKRSFIYKPLHLQAICPHFCPDPITLLSVKVIVRNINKAPFEQRKVSILQTTILRHVGSVPIVDGQTHNRTVTRHFPPCFANSITCILMPEVFRMVEYLPWSFLREIVQGKALCLDGDLYNHTDPCWNQDRCGPWKDCSEGNDRVLNRITKLPVCSHPHTHDV